MALNALFYQKFVKPVCFQYDPEKVHNFFLKMGKMIESNHLARGMVRAMFHYENSMLSQKIKGITFSNPIGLSAGFDKNAELIPIVGDVGFGFTEVGSITAKPCKGNSGKRLMRLPSRQAIWVNFGLNNAGTDEITSRLYGQKFDIPVGISIAKTNCKETVDAEIAIRDYTYSLAEFDAHNIGNYFTINISCPNAYGGQPFSDPKLYERLLKEIRKLDIQRPIFVKLSPDLDKKTLDAIMKLSEKYGVSGFICSNLTKNNTGFKKGGVSGKMVSLKADFLLSRVYLSTRSWKNKPILVGVGGIFSAEDAYRKIQLGANLVQMITGMIYQGPNVISEINKGIVELLKIDGLKNISEAVGAFHSKAKREETR